MTELLKKAIDEAKKLSDNTQDIIAKHLLTLLNLEGFIETTGEADMLHILQDELMWDLQFAQSADLLEKMANEALEDYVEGRTISLDKLLSQI